MELMERDTTQKRLDDLNAKVVRGFERVDADLLAQRAESRAEFGAVRTEMKAGFDAMNQRFDLMNDSMNQRFEAMHRLMIQVGSVLTAALIGTQL